MATDFKLAAILEFANKSGPGIQSATKGLDSLNKTARDSQKALATGGRAMKSLGASGKAAKGDLSAFQKAVQAGGSAMKSFDTSSEAAYQMMLGTGRAASMTAGQMGTLASGLGVTSRAQADAAARMQQLIGAWDRGEISSQQLTEELKKLDTENREAASSTSQLGQVINVAMVAVAAKAAISIGKAAYELGVLGAQSLRTKRAFEAISGGAGAAADNLDAMRRATRGAMSEQAMMASANRLLQMGLAGNAAELEQITTMATRLGSAMGKEAGPAVEEFALMLANQSIPRLDTFGISASKVRARILELQAATPGLSREVAFMQATMEQGTKAMERLGDAADDELLANERLEASMADLKAMAGEALAPAMAKVAAAAVTVKDAVIDAQREIDNLRDEFGDATVEAAETEDNIAMLADATAILSGELAVTGEELYQAGTAMDSLKQQKIDIELREAALSLWEVREAAEYTSPSIVATSDAMHELSTAAKTVAGSFGEMEFDNEQMWKMAAASGATLPQLEELARRLGIASSAEIEATKNAYALVEGFGAGTVSAEEYTSGFRDLRSAEAEALIATQASQASIEQMRSGMQESGEATNALTGGLDASAEAGAAAQGGIQGAADASGTLTEQADASFEAIETLQGGMQEAAVTAEILAEKLAPPVTVMGDLEIKAVAVQRALSEIERDIVINVYYKTTGRLPPGAAERPGGGERHQSGTAFHRGGLALIGEGTTAGELVALPRGSRVWPASSPQTQAARNNRYNYGGDTIYINDRLAAALYMEQRRRDRMQRLENM